MSFLPSLFQSHRRPPNPSGIRRILEPTISFTAWGLPAEPQPIDTKVVECPPLPDVFVIPPAEDGEDAYWAFRADDPPSPESVPDYESLTETFDQLKMAQTVVPVFGRVDGQPLEDVVIMPKRKSSEELRAAVELAVLVAGTTPSTVPPRSASKNASQKSMKRRLALAWKNFTRKENINDSESDTSSSTSDHYHLRRIHSRKLSYDEVRPRTQSCSDITSTLPKRSEESTSSIHRRLSGRRNGLFGIFDTAPPVPPLPLAIPPPPEEPSNLVTSPTTTSLPTIPPLSLDPRSPSPSQSLPSISIMALGLDAGLFSTPVDPIPPVPPLPLRFKDKPRPLPFTLHSTNSSSLSSPTSTVTSLVESSPPHTPTEALRLGREGASVVPRGKIELEEFSFEEGLTLDASQF
jgi:hypothetical protein